jgi:TolB-like protein/Tfp pilus assembly protein PilF
LLGLAAVAALLFVPRFLPGSMPSPPAGGRAVIRSLAVLPLSNLSGDPEQDYFADGMTDLLIADLAQIGALRVISRTSVMKYRDERRSLPEIARELNVDAVVEGSVVRAGDRVRITAQLVHAPTDAHLWASTFERSMRDVLSIQSEVARAIAREIRITLTPRESARLGSAATVDPEAQEAYLKGRYWWNKRTEEGFRRGIEFFQQAIEKDPAYARGHAGLALSYDLLGFYNYMPASEAFTRAIDAATKAISMDDSLGEAHAALAYARLYAFWDWEGAGTEFRRAIELDPGDATLRHWQALYLAYTGRTDAAIDEIRRARDLDPLSLAINAAVGWIYYFARDYRDAETHSRRALELDPNLSLALWVLSATQVQTGRYDDALEILERMGTGAPYAPGAIRAIAAGNRSGALTFLDSLGNDTERNQTAAYTLAYHYALLGEKDLAFHWLERALEARERWLVYLKAEPVFDPIRDDPRFARLLQKVGFPS